MTLFDVDLEGQRANYEGEDSMNATQAEALIVADADGNYFVLPREHIELSKIRKEAKPEVEKLLGDQKVERIKLGGGYSYVGVISIPELKWTHYSPDLAWPHSSDSG